MVGKLIAFLALVAVALAQAEAHSVEKRDLYYTHHTGLFGAPAPHVLPASVQARAYYAAPAPYYASPTTYYAPAAPIVPINKEYPAGVDPLEHPNYPF